MTVFSYLNKARFLQQNREDAWDASQLEIRDRSRSQNAVVRAKLKFSVELRTKSLVESDSTLR